MKQTDENFVSMCRAVGDVLVKHNGVWAVNAAFGNQVTQFNNLMNELSVATEGAEIVSTGATENKAAAELKAVQLAVNLAKRGSVYALESGNMELHDQLRVTKSTLLRRPDTMAVAKLRDIFTRLSAVAGALGSYGVSGTELATLKDLTDAFDALIARPRDLIVERKGYNQEAIPGLLTGLREVLYKMDSLVNIFEGSDFGTEYKNARMIIELGKRGGGETPPVVS